MKNDWQRKQKTPEGWKQSGNNWALNCRHSVCKQIRGPNWRLTERKWRIRPQKLKGCECNAYRSVYKGITWRPIGSKLPTSSSSYWLVKMSISALSKLKLISSICQSFFLARTSEWFLLLGTKNKNKLTSMPKLRLRIQIYKRLTQIWAIWKRSLTRKKSN